MKRIGILIFTAVLCTACQPGRVASPHIIVIAVDQLGVNEISCSKEPESDSGFDLLCADSVRLTHAFTPSVLSGPALASLLTGEYPLHHGLRHHDQSWLPSSKKTLAEVALANGYRTAFFSGGPPILRKLNLHQGFELYDDLAPLNELKAYKPFEKQADEFWDWQSHWTSKPMLGLFYVPDLSYWREPTRDRLGEIRDLSTISQVEELNESLGTFIQTMKAKKIWDNSLVVLVGLQGPQSLDRDRELAWENLLTERAQVTILIKPAQKPRDVGLSWSFDDNATLADLGKTLIEVFEPLEVSPSSFPVVSLQPLLLGQSSFSVPERAVLIESGWGLSKNESSLRYSARKGHLAFIHDLKPKIFNSLSDRLEVAPYPAQDSSIREFASEMSALFEREKLAAWQPFTQEQILKWWGLSEVWNATTSRTSAVTLERLSHRLPLDTTITDQFVYDLLQKQDWAELLSWAQSSKSKELEKLAKLHLRNQKTKFQEPCLQLANAELVDLQNLKKCEDPVALDFLKWQIAIQEDPNGSRTEALRRKFFYRYSLLTMDRWLSQAYWALQGPWSLAPTLAGQLQKIDLILALPKYSRERTLAQKNFYLKPTSVDED